MATFYYNSSIQKQTDRQTDRQLFNDLLRDSLGKLAPETLNHSGFKMKQEIMGWE